MRALLLFVLAGMALLAQRVPAQSATITAPRQSSVADFVAEAARRFAIPESWIYAVMRVESAGDPRALSPKGATGLMQIMPRTWLQLRVRYALGGDIYDPHDNIIAGAAYLRELYDRYGSPGFLAAYNAGPRRYESYLARGIALPGETIAYLRKLAPLAAGKPREVLPREMVDPTAWTRSELFAGALRHAAPQGGSTASSADIAAAPAAPAQRTVAPQPGASSLFIPLFGRPHR